MNPAPNHKLHQQPKQQRKILVTAALPYANGPIHLGHLVEYLQTDFWARFQRLRGNKCIYICADDTHGTPIMVQARKEGITPEELIARSQREHYQDFTDFEIKFDIYSSTNTSENKVFAEEFFLKMRDAGHIAVKPIQQLYCLHDKMFLPDRFVKGICPKCGSADQYGDSCDKCSATYSPFDLKEPKCSVCGSTPVQKETENLFFKLNDFRDFLREWVPQHTPKEVSAKLSEWLGDELRDWDISRDEPYFGFEIPGYKGKYFYVWLDAPIGYISSTSRWCEQTGHHFGSIWREGDYEIYHFIGKDIINFHCLFWPAMLKVAGFKLPNQVFVHGHLTVNGEKMSKSKGTSLSARDYLGQMDPMYLRYYYASKLSPTLNDFDISGDDFANRVNSDLVGKITNLGSRGAQMLSKRIDGKTGGLDAEGKVLISTLRARSEIIAGQYEKREFARVVESVRELADLANKYFDEKAPWNLIKTDIEATRCSLTAALSSFRILAIYLAPILPKYAERVAKLLGERPYVWNDIFVDLTPRHVLEYEHLANRIEPAQFQAMIDRNLAATVSPTGSPKVSQAAPPAGPSSLGGKMETAVDPTSTEIDMDYFTKVDLRVVKILEAEAVPEADKLIKLKVDLGNGQTKQIFAGIKSAYKPEALVGRLTVIVANLKPRKMKFGLSEGMVLAAGAGGSELFILSPDSGAQPGDKVK